MFSKPNKKGLKNVQVQINVCPSRKKKNQSQTKHSNKKPGENTLRNGACAKNIMTES